MKPRPIDTLDHEVTDELADLGYFDPPDLVHVPVTLFPPILLGRTRDPLA